MPTEELNDYPKYDLDSTIEKLDNIHKNIRSDNVDRENAAEILKMAHRGGAFSNLISAMEKFGFVDTVWGGKITFTELGKLVIYGTEDEIREAKVRAFNNIRLFKEIFEKFGKDANEEQFRAFLRQEAGVDVAKANKRAQQAHRIYSKFFETDTSTLVKTEKGSIKETLSIETPSEPIVQENLLILQFGQVYIRLPKDDISALKLAKQAIEMMEELSKKTEVK